MAENSDIDQFLYDHIDTIPHLEALLLLWNSRPKHWSPEEMASALYVACDSAADIMDDLARRRLVAVGTGEAPTYSYESEPDRDRLIAGVDATYRRELIRVSRLIHSKPSAAVRAFARAFQLKKDRE